MTQAYNHDAPSTSAVAGQFVVEADTPFGRQSGSIIYQVDGTRLTGTIEVLGHSVTVENGTVDGNTFHHLAYVKAPFPLGKVKVTVDGSVDGDVITGTIKSIVANAEFTGTRA